MGIVVLWVKPRSVTPIQGVPFLIQLLLVCLRKEQKLTQVLRVPYTLMGEEDIYAPAFKLTMEVN